MKITEWKKKVEKKLQCENQSFLRVKVSPGMAKNEIAEILEDSENTVKIRIAAPPEKGKANSELCKFLADYFDCRCQILSGQTHSLKLIQLDRN
ncbi:DUF167 domain-containing protein [Candidatus Gracilibacteria bacterium]|nr:DUF167 domain-containing protein [Candidatus Gracilibacteria bacterium]MCF7819697.1 DUF167 domain-containing protein [Candidatus Gracilibacteria bacterium]